MSDDEGAPRRSQRERKQVTHFNSASSSFDTTNKRKRDGEGSGDEAPSDGADEKSPDSDADDEPAPKPKATRRKKANGAPAAKKPRTSKAKTAVPKPPRKGRRAQGAGDAFDADAVAKETGISTDNHLFNAILNPASALQSKVEDFLESLTQTPEPALAELITCILRACGCNETVDGDEAVDLDGVVPKLDDFTENMKHDETSLYPLTSKLPVFRKFRKSLVEFLERLISSASELGLLYSTDLMEKLQHWVSTMSSSPVRSMRHTATVVALEVETALCAVTAAAEKEAEVVARQREGERKRKGKGKETKATAGRDSELEAKAAEIRQRRKHLSEFIQECIDDVFVHRYRDTDPVIRAEVVRALGAWFKTYPAHFVDAQYLRYVGWVLSDGAAGVRLAALGALAVAYAQAEHIGAMHHFTERFAARLAEMAARDTEAGVRSAAAGVLGAIDGHGLLDEALRDSLCLLVYDAEARVRRAVAGFVHGVWEERVEERLVGRKAGELEKTRAGVKALAVLLVEWGRALDGEGEAEEEKEARDVARLAGADQRARTALAVEALYGEIDVVSDWEAVLELLLLDHSAEAPQSSSGRKKKAKAKEQDDVVDEAWRLEEDEETVLLEVLVAALRKAKLEGAAGAKKGEEDTVSEEITRELTKALPRLFVKHQTDETRIAHVLVIPQLMNMDTYLEMRMMTAYGSLWDDVLKQFTSHSSPSVLKHACVTIQHLTAATSLANTNSTKMLELEDELATALRDAVAGKDELEIEALTGDEVLQLAALCARLGALATVKDISVWMADDDGGKQAAPWDILCILADRGKLGYKEEETMVSNALEVLSYHILWKTLRLPPPDVESELRDRLETQRAVLLEKLLDYAIGTQSNTADSVKRTAFYWLLNVHNLFYPAEAEATGTRLAVSSMPLTLEDEVQYRCAGFIQAAIERYAEELEEEDGEDEEEEDESDEEEGEGKKTKRRKGKKAEASSSRRRLEDEYSFLQTISMFLRSIFLRVVDVRHGALLLAHYGRLGPTFDQCTKSIIDVLKEDGMVKGDGDVVVEVVTRAIEEAFTLVLDGSERNTGNCIALAKVVASCFVIRGAHLSILKRLDLKYVVQIHTRLLTWIGKRLASYQADKNKKALEKAAQFFKVLVPLLNTMESREALQIKAHLEQVLAQSKVEVPPTAKAWDGERAYEKRLANVMSKDKAGAPKTRKSRAKKGKSAEEVTTDEEGGASDADDMADADEPVRAKPKAKPKPRPRRSTRAAAREAASDAEGAPEVEEPAMADGESADEAPATPRARGRPKKTYGSRSPSKQVAQSGNASPEKAKGNGLNGFSTPKSNRKRGRPAEEDDEESVASAPSVASSPATQVNEVVIKRKRARH